MPRIPDDILECVIYMYPSPSAAEVGEQAGGCGFLVGVPAEHFPEAIFLYAVTNSHVVREGSSMFVRANKVDGGFDVIATAEQQWEHHFNGDDLAVCPLNLEIGRHKFRSVPADSLLTENVVADFKIGPGDETFAVTRFMGHDGKQQNLPSVRFGNIAMMPWERVRHQRGYDVDSFLVESRSIPGHSGSPVFVHIPPLSARPGDSALQTASYGPWLLGIDWGHPPHYEEVVDQGGKSHPDGWLARANSGMMAVAPGWKIREVLYSDDRVRERRNVEEAARSR